MSWMIRNHATFLDFSSSYPFDLSCRYHTPQFLHLLIFIFCSLQMAHARVFVVSQHARVPNTYAAQRTKKTQVAPLDWKERALSLSRFFGNTFVRRHASRVGCGTNSSFINLISPMLFSFSYENQKRFTSRINLLVLNDYWPARPPS